MYLEMILQNIKNAKDLRSKLMQNISEAEKPAQEHKQFVIPFNVPWHLSGKGLVINNFGNIFKTVNGSLFSKEKETSEWVHCDNHIRSVFLSNMIEGSLKSYVDPTPSIEDLVLKTITAILVGHNIDLNTAEKLSKDLVKQCADKGLGIVKKSGQSKGGE